MAEEGWSDLLLVEKGEVTSGSTWHAAGQCPSFIADYNMARIHDYGVRLYPKLEEKTGQYVNWHGCGGIRFAFKPAEVEWFHHVAGVGKLIGFHCEIIDPEKIKQINPFVNVEGVLAGAWTTGDGHVDPAGCCNALARGARDMGATIARRTRVTDVKQRANGEWEVVTDQGNVVCEMVVNAAGCYARQVSRMAGSDVPITNMEHTQPGSAGLGSAVGRQLRVQSNVPHAPGDEARENSLSCDSRPRAMCDCGAGGVLPRHPDQRSIRLCRWS